MMIFFEIMRYQMEFCGISSNITAFEFSLLMTLYSVTPIIKSHLHLFWKCYFHHQYFINTAVIYSFFYVSISLGWEWKLTTGRFATGQSWPFTWKILSVGKDKINKWEFGKLKITTTVVFVIMIQCIFTSLELAPMLSMINCYSGIVDSSQHLICSLRSLVSYWVKHSRRNSISMRAHVLVVCK